MSAAPMNLVVLGLSLSEAGLWAAWNIVAKGLLGLTAFTHLGAGALALASSALSAPPR